LRYRRRVAQIAPAYVHISRATINQQRFAGQAPVLLYVLIYGQPHGGFPRRRRSPDSGALENSNI